MKRSSIPENVVTFLDPPKEEIINPIQNVADGVAEVSNGFLQSPGMVPSKTGWRLLDNGTAEFRKLIVGSKTIAVSPGQSIQAALDELANEGGGVVQLGAGTYYPTSSIVLPVKCPIRIEGENTSSTIIDFGSADRQIAIGGTGAYTSGTVSISSGVTVTGSSTNWLSSGLVAGDEIFLDSRWYRIAAISGNTTIILAEGYGGTALSGATYRAGHIARDIEIKELTIKNSTSGSGGIAGGDVRNLVLEDVTLVSNTKGMVIETFSELSTNRILVASSTNEGVYLTTGSLGNIKQLVTTANGDIGLKMNSVKTLSIEYSSSTGNTADGYNFTSCTDIFLSPQASGNGGQGIELVSGNDNILIDNGLVAGNTSDGIKLTATSDNCRISTSKITGNGGYGVNIAASSCDNNIIDTSNIFTGNTSGVISDSGSKTSGIYAVGAVQLAASDAEVTCSTTTYTKIKEATIANQGKGRMTVYFELKSGDGINAAYGKIYINDIAVGTERTNSTASYVAYSENFDVNPGDTVQLYAKKVVAGTNTRYANFRVQASRYDVTTITYSNSV